MGVDLFTKSKKDEQYSENPPPDVYENYEGQSYSQSYYYDRFGKILNLNLEFFFNGFRKMAIKK